MRRQRVNIKINQPREYLVGTLRKSKVRVKNLCIEGGPLRKCYELEMDDVREMTQTATILERHLSPKGRLATASSESSSPRLRLPLASLRASSHIANCRGSFGSG